MLIRIVWIIMLAYIVAYGQVDTCYVLRYDYSFCEAEILLTFDEEWGNSSIMDSLNNYLIGWTQYRLGIDDDSLVTINPKRIEAFNIVLLDTIYNPDTSRISFIDTTFGLDSTIIRIDTVFYADTTSINRIDTLWAEKFQAAFMVKDTADCSSRLIVPNIFNLIR